MIDAVTGITQREARQLELAKDAKLINEWREQNPFQSTRWLTAHGVVTGIFGWKFYRGECSACGTLLTDCRPYPKTKNWNTGKWPQMCPECSAAKREAHSNQARHRMARLRAQRNGDRDRMHLAIGMAPPRQGVAAKNTRPRGRMPAWASILRKPQSLVCARCWQPTELIAIRKPVELPPPMFHAPSLIEASEDEIT